MTEWVLPETIHFCGFIISHFPPPSQPANDPLPSLARPRSTRRYRGNYASRVLSRSACSNTTSRSYWQKKDNHSCWLDLGDRINSPMCICGKSSFYPVPPPKGHIIIYYLLIFWNRGMLVAGRIIAGISVGLSSAVVPIYQSEITAPAIRGRIVSLQAWYTRQYYFYNKLMGYL